MVPGRTRISAARCAVNKRRGSVPRILRGSARVGFASIVAVARSGGEKPTPEDGDSSPIRAKAVVDEKPTCVSFHRSRSAA